MTGTGPGSFFWFNFSRARDKILQKLGVFKINFFDIALTKMAAHNF
jgi:hypothetical protein